MGPVHLALDVADLDPLAEDHLAADVAGVEEILDRPGRIVVDVTGERKDAGGGAWKSSLEHRPRLGSVERQNGHSG